MLTNPNAIAIAHLTNIRVLPAAIPPGITWEKAVTFAGPDTGSSSPIWRVGGGYAVPPAGAGWLTLVNFPENGMELEDILAWGRTFGLPAASPYHIFACAAEWERLPALLGISSMTLVSPADCVLDGSPQVPVVLWPANGTRYATLRSVFGGFSGHCWFAFSGRPGNPA